MTTIVVVSPDRDLVAALQAGFSQAPARLRLLVLREYPAAGQLSEIIRAEQCEAAVIGLTGPDSAIGLIESLRTCHAGLPVVAAHRENSGELILAAARAGATAYVGPPFAPEDLQAALRSDPRAGQSAKGSLIAVVPACGGCGATTLAIHLAAAITASEERRTLLMDLDLQSSALDFRLKLRPQYSLAHALDRASDLDELWPHLATRWAGGELLAAPPPGKTTVEKWPRLPAVVASARRVYDVVVADLPPAVFHPHSDILAEASEVLLVSMPDTAALHMARRKAEELRRAGVSGSTLRLIMNRIGGRDSWSRKDLEEFVAMPVDATLSNDYASLRQACLEGGLVGQNSVLAQEFRALARRLISPRPVVEPEEVGWKSWLSVKGLGPRRWAKSLAST